MRGFVIAATFLAMAEGAAAQVGTSNETSTVTAPDLNKEHLVSAGETLWSIRTANIATTDRSEYVLEERAFGGGFFSTKGTAEALAGAKLVGVSTSAGVKACEPGSTETGFGSVRACFVDADNDGAFDHYSYNEGGALGKMKKPARYRLVRQIDSEERGNFLAQVTYLGVAAGGLSLSYREFTNDIARPAFTENLSVPLGTAYPQTVRFKGIEMKVLSVDGMGLRYMITTAPSSQKSN